MFQSIEDFDNEEQSPKNSPEIADVK
jgi:hypothetical protein